MSKEDLFGVALYFKFDEHIFYLCTLKQINSDGSLIVYFPDLPKRTYVSQKLTMELNNNNSLGTFKITEQRSTEPAESNREEQTRITYHTTGQVNYHNSSHASIFLEPLHHISTISCFYILSMPDFNSFNNRYNHAKRIKRNNCILDVSQLKDQRINWEFYIAPSDVEVDENSLVKINFSHVFSILIVPNIDRNSLNFGSIYNNSEFVRIAPSSGLYSSLPSTISDAKLKYMHVLYRAEGLMIFGPGLDGTIALYFTVEMRIPPLVKIELENPNQYVNLIEKSKIHIVFKIINKITMLPVTDAKDIIITNLILDAEIYTENDIIPGGYI